MSKNILMISAHDVWGSVNTFSPMLKIILYLAEKNYMIDFVTIEKKKEFDRASIIYGEPVDDIHPNVSINRIRVGNPTILSVLFRIPLLGRVLKKIRIEKIFPYLVYMIYKNKEKKYDLIYAYEIFAVSVSKKLSVKREVPLLTRFQGTFLIGWLANLPQWLFKIKYRLHIKALSTPADIIIMTDDGTQGNKALEYLNNFKNVEFLKNGIDFRKVDVDKNLLKKRLGLPEGKYITISVSRLSRWKKLERIIFAYEELIKLGNDYVHVFIGDGEERDLLMSECLEKNLNSNIIFVGQKNHDEVQEYLSCADVFISLFDSTNVGNPLQEAIKMELPVITYNVGDTSRLIKDGYNGILLNNVDPRSVAIAVNKIRTNDVFRDKLIEGVKETSKSLWSWEERLAYEEKKIKSVIGENEC